ncbi:hypothetical protein HI914_06507 [Erysiphe necator]|uniref:Putative r3h and g-patch domain-containing protein n=1 Tax=Uncinula necator TaxID=52586 RepID=A0A0B1PAY5_UNCNE|nr:hypothetical protein HI914_06507 [Erysiphe necator]KHJ33784.1 putative r3h and g-patch domain-containing protein [Erysiphe necator]
MAHSKNVSRRSNNKSRPYGRGEARKSLVPIAKSSTKPSPSEFTLKDEALSTSSKKRQWYSQRNLRNSRVVFVNAEDSQNDKVENTSEVLISESGAESKEPEQKIITPPLKQQFPRKKSTENLINSFHIGESINIGPFSTQIRSISPTPSSSSDEIILFQGRNPPKASVDALSEKKDIIKEKESENLEESARKSDCSSGHEPLQLSCFSKEILSPKPVKKICTQLLETQLNQSSNVKINLQDESMNDYLANINPKNSNKLIIFSRRDLGGTPDFEYEEPESPIQSIAEYEVFKNVSNIEKKNNPRTFYTSHKPGAQFNSQAGSRKISTAISRSSSMSTSSTSSTSSNNYSINFKHHNFETELLDNPTVKTQDSDDSGDSEKSEYDDTKIDIFTHFYDKKENVKRILTKYGDLGTSSDNETSKSYIQDTYLSRKYFHPPSPSKRKRDKKKKKRGLGKGKKKSVDSYPDYDELDIFDIMDFDRPVVSKKKTALKFPDPTMDEYMKMAVQNNRLKKQEKKKEREILRNLGLLGNKKTKQDLRHKYKTGMDFDELKREVKAFLKDGTSTLVLPPMKKSNRQVVHEMANMLKLKSKSNGIGASRFPVLYRTSRTTQYAEDIFQSMELAFTRGFFPRNNYKFKKYSKNNKFRKNGTKKAAVSYREGEIVGGSAPEISVNNKGRTMLEKMGWSSGTALGALNNKGILQPLSQTVKKSKRGLA